MSAKILTGIRIPVPLCYTVGQWFSTRILQNPGVSPVQSRGSTTSYMYFHFILLINLNAVFCIRQLNYYKRVPRATGIFFLGSAPAKRLKIIAVGYSSTEQNDEKFWLCILVCYALQKLQVI